MRILYVHQYFATPRGRTGTRSYEQARRMIAAGHDVTMLTSSAQLREDEIPAGRGIERRGEIEGIPCIVLDVPYTQGMSYLRRAWAFIRFMLSACRITIREPDVDLVFATTTPLTIAVVALAGRWLRGRPYIFEVRDLWPEIPLALGILKPGLLSWTLARLERLVYRHANGWVAVNEDVALAMERTAGLKRPTAIAPNACDLELFHPQRDGSSFRAEHQLGDAVLAVHTGAMGPVNGLEHILNVADELRDLTQLQFVLIGEGNQKDKLIERVQREKLDQVRILDGIPKERLADLLATAEIGLMTVCPTPILELNCANKFFDYLASGLPIALNYRGWQARTLDEYACGLSADQGDDAGYAALIRAMATDPKRRKAMSLGARHAAEIAFSRERVVDGILTLLDEVKALP
jgi:glycosyltransferase involved in cell wall biosynthesis